MGLGALGVLAIPVLDGPVLEAIVEWDPGPRLNPLLAHAIALFGAPSIILAGVAPIAVRLHAQSLATLGQTAGRLFAISTAGSIAGTFATAFWLIPEFGTDQLLDRGGRALRRSHTLRVCRAPRRDGGRRAGRRGPGQRRCGRARARDRGHDQRGAGAELVAALPPRRLRCRTAANGYCLLTLRYAKDTRYHRLSVADDEENRYLRFDNSYQSGMIKGAPSRRHSSTRTTSTSPAPTSRR